jgi:hypothetical protein
MHNLFKILFDEIRIFIFFYFYFELILGLFSNIYSQNNAVIIYNQKYQ